VEVFPVSLPRKKPFTIALDERVYTLHDVYRVIESKAADVINIKVAKCGGINPSLKIAHAAQSAGVPCFFDGCTETGVGTAAALHFAACAPNLIPGVEAGGSGSHIDDIVMEPLTAYQGVIQLSDKLGIGVEVDANKLRKYSEI